ncbi:NUDIX domain-containing protein [Branchiibius hedensis]|uniref:NUDIX domain-containing protein n=1 Tax=Branchiibius hedensis TaxID=672460 RepID=A0A2Y8ZRF0_9MICO|nr:NUDIX domain-containing protein [Branchiibius hedensis]PWJ25191.1 NUDIX domain-containing protein [Branchiibius hedensis]SSA34006.1 NUDIX domain-containing protein [Branchiibius hedensis]
MRETVRSAVAAIAPIDVLAGEHIRDALTWIDSGADLFRVERPATPSPHLVSYFVPIDTTRRTLLLEEHLRSGLWLPPGGHVEVDEDPRDAVRRECLEELGVEARFLAAGPLLVTITDTTREVHTDVSLWYAIALSQDEPMRIDTREMASVRWFSFAEATGLDPMTTDPHLARFVSAIDGLLAVTEESAFLRTNG